MIATMCRKFITMPRWKVKKGKVGQGNRIKTLASEKHQ